MNQESEGGKKREKAENIGREQCQKRYKFRHIRQLDETER